MWSAHTLPAVADPTRQGEKKRKLIESLVTDPLQTEAESKEPRLQATTLTSDARDANGKKNTPFSSFLSIQCLALAGIKSTPKDITSVGMEIPVESETQSVSQTAGTSVLLLLLLHTGRQLLQRELPAFHLLPHV